MTKDVSNQKERDEDDQVVHKFLMFITAWSGLVGVFLLYCYVNC